MVADVVGCWAAVFKSWWFCRKERTSSFFDELLHTLCIVCGDQVWRLLKRLYVMILKQTLCVMQLSTSGLLFKVCVAFEVRRAIRPLLQLIENLFFAFSFANMSTAWAGLFLVCATAWKMHPNYGHTLARPDPEIHLQGSSLICEGCHRFIQ